MKRETMIFRSFMNTINITKNISIKNNIDIMFISLFRILNKESKF